MWQLRREKKKKRCSTKSSGKLELNTTSSDTFRIMFASFVTFGQYEVAGDTRNVDERIHLCKFTLIFGINGK